MRYFKLIFPYKKTPFVTVNIPAIELHLKKLYPIVVMWNDSSVQIYHSYNGNPDVEITAEEYERVCLGIDYQEEFQTMLDKS